MSRDESVSCDSLEGHSFHSIEDIRFDSTDEVRSRPSWADPKDSRGVSSAEERSLECSAVRVEILRGINNGNHIQYEILVETGINSWTILRRYSDFCYLDDALNKRLETDKSLLPPMPPKKYLGSSTSENFIKERR